MTGVAPWSDDYTQPCFDTSVTFFRTIPGQPISFLLDIIDRVHFTERTIALNLAYKSLNGSEVGQILAALARQQVRVSSLNLTGNVLATTQDYDAIMPLLTGSLTQLVLDDVGLESGTVPGANATATIRMASWLPQVDHLQYLSIKNFKLGWHSDQGIEAVAEAIERCTRLQHVVIIGGGYLGSTHQGGIVKLARAITKLPNLWRFQLSGLTLQDAGAHALALAFPQTAHLQVFAMHDMLNEASANATMHFLDSFALLPALEELDLTGSQIGVYGSETMPNASFQPIAALAQTLPSMRRLRALRLNDTFLGYKGAGNGSTLLKALEARTRPLEVFELKGAYFSRAITDRLNTLLKNWQLPAMPIQLKHANETRAYLADLQPHQTDLTFEDGPQNDDSLRAIFQGIANTSITSLAFQGLRFLPSASGFEGLSACTQLKGFEMQLRLNGVAVTMSNPAWLSLLNQLASLTQLQRLSLAWTAMLWYTDDPFMVTFAFTSALEPLTQLRTLDLTNTMLGADGFITAIILDTLTSLPHLQALDVSSNPFGLVDNGASEQLLTRLHDFPALSQLDISQCDIGAYPGATAALSHSLRTMDRPFQLLAARTKLGQYPREAQDLMVTIANNTHLRATLTDAGFGSELWPPVVARLASQTYDPILQAACSNLQCFGIQPTLPNLGNNTRIHFKAKNNHEPLAAFTTLVTVGLLAVLMCLGLGFLCYQRTRPRSIQRPLPSRSLSLTAPAQTTRPHRPLTTDLHVSTPTVKF